MIRIEHRTLKLNPNPGTNIPLANSLQNYFSTAPSRDKYIVLDNSTLCYSYKEQKYVL